MGRALIALFAVCACKAPPPPCSADLSTDSFNCGTCDNVCAGGTRCEDGRCVATCAGLRCVNDVCVEPMSDPLNCGACGVVCEPMHAPPVCLAGSCSHGPCETGWYDCDGDAVNGCESADFNCVIEVCGRHANGAVLACFPLAMSDDGRRVLFTSRESDYVAGDDSYTNDFFLFEVPTRTYRRVLRVERDFEPRAGALSGDGTRAVLMTTKELVVMDLETGAVVPPPPVPSRAPDDAGLLFVESEFFHFSYDGRLLTRGAGQSLSGPYWFVSELPAGPTQLVRSLQAIHLSGDGQLVGLVLSELPDTFYPQAPYVVTLDGGAAALLVPRRPSPEGSPGYCGAPELSYDGAVAAFVTNRTGYGDHDDAGMIDRVVVVRDGGVVLEVLGNTPGLSRDGSRLGYTVWDPFGPHGCAVADVSSGERVFSSEQLSAQSYCLVKLTADGRTALVVFDGAFSRPGYLVRLPPQ